MMYLGTIFGAKVWIQTKEAVVYKRALDFLGSLVKDAEIVVEIKTKKQADEFKKSLIEIKK